MYVYFIPRLLNLVFKYSKIMQQVNKIRLFTPSQYRESQILVLLVVYYNKVRYDLYLIFNKKHPLFGKIYTQGVQPWIL